MKLDVPSIGSMIQRGFGGIALDGAAFLHVEAPVRPCMLKFLTERLLGPFVCHGHEVRRTLAAHLQLLDLAEVAPDARRRLASGALHDGDQS
jgi:hypothetical protein